MVVIQSDVFEDGKVTETTVKLADGHVGRNPGVDVKVRIPGVTCERDTFAFPANCAATTSFKTKCKPDGCLQKGADGSIVPVAATLDYKMQSAYVKTRPAEKQTLQRRQRLCGTCQGEGDPHIKNLDGAKFDFQTPGVTAVVCV
ncbi:hypothetical protein P43SY_011251 [Pythium insidiosum]|uniref:VWFD domain-containing protein n=1 Tax=Pythium insidiosum TaxID=114742 RepID=A0AAD5L5L4_PYTIN|nr:hypothetical protein P43SY_011251 [Pythium insidiosum]